MPALSPAHQVILTNNTDGIVSGRSQSLAAMRKRGLIDDGHRITPDGWAAIGAPTTGPESDAETPDVDRDVPASPGIPDRLAGRLAAMRVGEYGDKVRAQLDATPQHPGETATRYTARLRHALYRAGHDRAGDALQSIGGN